MKQMIFACLALLMVASAMVGGCRAEGEVDTDAAVQVPVPR